MATTTTTTTATASVTTTSSTKQNIKILIDEIETISKELIMQTANSNNNKTKATSLGSAQQQQVVVVDSTHGGYIDIVELTRLLIQKQDELNRFMDIAIEQQSIHEKIEQMKSNLSSTDNQIKLLVQYLKEAEQIISSAVYQSKMKLDMIRSSKPLKSEDIIRYAHKISADLAVCCPENWSIENSRRPYPTDADMRRGWLSKLNFNDFNQEQQAADQEQDYYANKRILSRSNSQVINPIVPNDFGSKDEFMSDSTSDSMADDD